MYGVATPNNRLNIMELHRKINQRNEKKSVCYEKVLEICQKRILLQSERDKTSCFFEFPEYLPGYPLFDLNACIKYCEKQLVANGFLVRYFFPNKFYISWDFDEIKKHKEDQRKITPLGAVLPQGVPQVNTETVKKPMMLPPSSSQIQNTTQNQPMSITNMTQTTSNIIKPPQQPFYGTIGQLPNTISALQAKITMPLPTNLPKYDPFDLYSPSIHSPNATTSSNVNGEGKRPSAIDNSFFANSFKSTLTSGIGPLKMFDYKPSGKLTLNL